MESGWSRYWLYHERIPNNTANNDDSCYYNEKEAEGNSRCQPILIPVVILIA